MGLEDDPTDPTVLENLRRSIVMLNTGQRAPLERERVLLLLEELQRLQADHRDAIAQLRAILDRLEHRANRR